MRKIGIVNTRNRLATRGTSKFLDGPARLRSRLIDQYVAEVYCSDKVMKDDGRQEVFIRQAAIGGWHASCSRRMGSDDNRMAVTDMEGRVRGLHVAGASLFPVESCANTNIPTLMLAQTIADAIVAGG